MDEFQADIADVGRIDVVPRILDVVCRTTGMRFAAVARVTEERWVTCLSRDDIPFGLTPGDELKLETTLCNEVRQTRQAVVIDHVAEDDCYRDHPTPALYGFQSYISVPILLADGTFFGTLCAIDPLPVRLNTPETIGMFELFAELIALHLNAARQLDLSAATLAHERRTSEVREQFIAVLGHDLRNPLASIEAGSRILLRTPLDEKATEIVTLMRGSVTRMASLIDSVMDFARARLGGGFTVERSVNGLLGQALSHVVSELRLTEPERILDAQIDIDRSVFCDGNRLAQLFSNLLANAVAHGAPDAPIRTRASTREGELVLSVSNAGDPIPAAARERLFDPFTRGAVRPHHKGLGLGLYIASEIARAHGGTLAVESTAEETCFTFRMPLV